METKLLLLCIVAVIGAKGGLAMFHPLRNSGVMLDRYSVLQDNDLDLLVDAPEQRPSYRHGGEDDLKPLRRMSTAVRGQAVVDSLETDKPRLAAKQIKAFDRTFNEKRRKASGFTSDKDLDQNIFEEPPLKDAKYYRYGQKQISKKKVDGMSETNTSGESHMGLKESTNDDDAAEDYRLQYTKRKNTKSKGVSDAGELDTPRVRAREGEGFMGSRSRMDREQKEGGLRRGARKNIQREKDVLDESLDDKVKDKDDGDLTEMKTKLQKELTEDILYTLRNKVKQELKAELRYELDQRHV